MNVYTFSLQGEWLAFTARAEEAGFWDVGASVASGLNGTTVEFRILVNATNCSTADTDGLDGLGDQGVDLLNGPLSGGFTGSWEAFEMILKEEVYVPQGTHRFLFCSDAGVFNMNFLRVWTPEATLAPTMAPTLAPTPAPLVPSDDGLDTKWIFIGVSRVESSRVGWPGGGEGGVVFSCVAFVEYTGGWIGSARMVFCVGVCVYAALLAALVPRSSRAH